MCREGISDMKILYLHGIGSGAESRTPTELRKIFTEVEILAPELPVRPKAIVELLKDKYWNDDEIDLVIGTSLGGFFALTFPAAKRILINPALFADEDIEKGIGYSSQPFLCERSDGAKEYIIDDGYISELKNIRDSIYKDWIDADKEHYISNTYAIFGERDELLDHVDDFKALFDADKATMISGEHRLSVEEIHTVLAPLIEQIMDKC